MLPAPCNGRTRTSVLPRLLFCFFSFSLLRKKRSPPVAVNNSQQVPLPLALKTFAGQGKVKDGGAAEATFSFDYMVARLVLPLLCWPRPAHSAPITSKHSRCERVGVWVQECKWAWKMKYWASPLPSSPLTTLLDQCPVPHPPPASTPAAALIF